MTGVVAGGVSATDVPIYDSETQALKAELNGGGATESAARVRTRPGSSS